MKKKNTKHFGFSWFFTFPTFFCQSLHSNPLHKMNFSPYSPSPDDDRTRLPKKQKQPKQQQQTQQTSYSSYQAGSSVNDYSYAEQGLLGSGNVGASGSNGGGAQTVRINKYETSLPIRVDVEASLAYVLGPVTGKRKKGFYA